MALTKSGYLFCSAEREDHRLYLILSDESGSEPVYTHSQMAQNNLVEFEHLGSRKMLEMTDCIEQYGPLTDLKIISFQERNTQ